MSPSDKDIVEQESTEFMAQDNDELVDLDALFDALNLVAKENAESLDFASGTDQDGGILTVTNEALATAGVTSSLDDLAPVSGDGITGSVLSDES